MTSSPFLIIRGAKTRSKQIAKSGMTSRTSIKDTELYHTFNKATQEEERRTALKKEVPKKSHPDENVYATKKTSLFRLSFRSSLEAGGLEETVAAVGDARLRDSSWRRRLVLGGKQTTDEWHGLRAWRRRRGEELGGKEEGWRGIARRKKSNSEEEEEELRGGRREVTGEGEEKGKKNFKKRRNKKTYSWIFFLDIPILKYFNKYLSSPHT